MLQENDSKKIVPSPFIVGAARSGTTLLRMMLDSHPLLAIPPETHFIPFVLRSFRTCESPQQFAQVLTSYRTWKDFHIDTELFKKRIERIKPFTLTEGLRSFYRLYSEQQGKPRWGDKTPPYSQDMTVIQKLLPEARFIHMIRDGRDVAVSMCNLQFGIRSYTQAAKWWVKRIETAKMQKNQLSYYLEVRYEDLIGNAENKLKEICDFIDLKWDPTILDYHKRAPKRLKELEHFVTLPDGSVGPNQDRLDLHRLTTQEVQTTRIGRWKTEMSKQDRIAFEKIAGDLLQELGYKIAEPV